MSKLETAKAKWNDTVTENDVVAKFGVSKRTLRKMRADKKIMKFRYINPSATQNEKRPGKNPVYSLTELTEIFCP